LRRRAGPSAGGRGPPFGARRSLDDQRRGRSRGEGRTSRTGGFAIDHDRRTLPPARRPPVIEPDAREDVRVLVEEYGDLCQAGSVVLPARVGESASPQARRRRSPGEFTLPPMTGPSRKLAPCATASSSAPRLDPPGAGGRRRHPLVDDRQDDAPPSPPPGPPRATNANHRIQQAVSASMATSSRRSRCCIYPRGQSMHSGRREQAAAARTFAAHPPRRARRRSPDYANTHNPKLRLRRDGRTHVGAGQTCPTPISSRSGQGRVMQRIPQRPARRPAAGPARVFAVTGLRAAADGPRAAAAPAAQRARRRR